MNNFELNNTLFRNVKSMKDYGSSLEWPAPPRALKHTANKFQVSEKIDLCTM